MHKRATISALIVAKNEAEQLPGCLDSLHWVDEIVVIVDASSHDGTEAIARDRAHQCAIRNFRDFATQRNTALALATSDWVLAIDADERVTPELATEIDVSILRTSSGHAGYQVPIRSVLFGRPFRFSGTQSDSPLRLFRRTCGNWSGAVHETVQLNGSTGRLRSHLDHTTHETMNHFLTKLIHYTDLESRDLREGGQQPRVFDLTLRPLGTFLKRYFLHQGFRDGVEGFVFCALSAVSTAVRGWKLRELWRQSRQTVQGREVMPDTGLAGLVAGGRR